MKTRFISCLFALLLFPAGASAQDRTNGAASLPLTPAQSAALAEASQLNTQVIELYRQKKFGDALKLATQVQSLIEQNGLAEDLTALTMLGNVGEVLLAKGKESDAIALFQRNLAAYRKSLGENSVPEAETIDRITRAYFDKGDYANAETYALRLEPLFAKLYGPESAKVAGAETFLGDIYRFEGNMDSADANYLKAIAINDQVFSPEEKKNRTDLDNYTCFLHQWGYKENRMADAVNRVAQFERLRSEREHRDRSSDLVNAGVVNGKAVHLARPPYPPQLARTRGFVIVKLTIDEKGNVIAAKATCGIRGFLSISEDAAKNSKFTPTLLKGVPVRVTGTIIYNFGSQ